MGSDQVPGQLSNSSLRRLRPSRNRGRACYRHLGKESAVSQLSKSTGLSKDGWGTSWRQETGFGRAVVGLSALSLHHAKALTSKGSGWEPASPGHFEGQIFPKVDVFTLSKPVKGLWFPGHI